MYLVDQNRPKIEVIESVVYSQLLLVGAGTQQLSLCLFRSEFEIGVDRCG